MFYKTIIFKGPQNYVNQNPIKGILNYNLNLVPRNIDVMHYVPIQMAKLSLQENEKYGI